MIKAVLFDLDGTLVNSLEDLAVSTNYALSRFGFPTHETEKYRYFVGDGMPKLIERALPENKRDKDTMNAVLKVFLEHYGEHFADHTRVYTGIEDLLTDIKRLKLRTAVISNKSQKPAEAVVGKLFSPECFDIICGKREEYPAKPDPALTLKVVSELGVHTEECVLVGDSGMDMAAAKNAGIIGIGVLWGFRTEDELKSNGASYIVDSPKKIAEIIMQLNKHS